MEDGKFRKWKISSGISLIEILVVVMIFAVLGILVTSSLVLTLQGSKKSEAMVAVRENLDYSMSVIQRQLINASSVNCTTSTSTLLNYADQNGTPSTFACQGSAGNYSVASGSAATLTSTAVKVTNCSFTCTAPAGHPSYVDISLTAQSATITGAQNATENVNTRVYLRNY
jgi:type II secretory pathway pseudopilin PulG